MKRFIVSTIFCCLIGISLYAQKAIFYNEGPIMYPFDYYSFEVNVRVMHHHGILNAT